ncbi:uncharacterized protein CTRU02_203795 [Colletotrichum truncatum]|uniref:Uncharacterized protein n=1 Tax=Colletotrichum truncatum TaxID=5467 RepID=A0ACC3ZAX8_COLTU
MPTLRRDLLRRTLVMARSLAVLALAALPRRPRRSWTLRWLTTLSPVQTPTTKTPLLLPLPLLPPVVTLPWRRTSCKRYFDTNLASNTPTNAKNCGGRRGATRGGALIFPFYAFRGTLKQIAGRGVDKWRLWDSGFGFDMHWFSSLQIASTAFRLYPKLQKGVPSWNEPDYCQQHICFARFSNGHVL